MRSRLCLSRFGRAAGGLVVLALASAVACDGGGDESPVGPSDVPVVTPGPAPAPTTPPTTTAQGNSLYVSPTGSDAADGRTSQTALETLARALQIVQPGETVRLLPGVYVESMEVTLRGLPGRPITITGEGGVAVLSGNRQLRIGLWCEECAYVRIENLEIRDYRDIGVRVVLSDQVTLDRLRVHHNGFSPSIFEVEGYGLDLDESSNRTIENNEVYHNGPDPRSPMSVGTGINTFAIRQSVIRNNRSYDNIGGGILVEDSTNVLVEGNTIFDNDLDVTADEWWDGGIWLDGGRDVTIRNNVFRNNRGPGIEISDEDIQRPRGYVLENNISTGNYFGIYIWNFGSTDFPPSDVLQRSGNDFSGNTRQDVWIEAMPCPTPCP